MTAHKGNRILRIQFDRCPNEPQGDDPHWVLMAWSAREKATICRFHGQDVQVHLREPLKRGLVSPEENERGWTSVIPDPYDEAVWRESNKG